MAKTSYLRTAIMLVAIMTAAILIVTMAYGTASAKEVSEDNSPPPNGDMPSSSAREALQAAAQIEATQDLDGEEVDEFGDPIDLIEVNANNCDVDSGDSITFEVVDGPDDGEFATVIDGVNANIEAFDDGDLITVEDIDDSSEPIEFFVEDNGNFFTDTLDGDDELIVDTSTIDCNSPALKVTDRKPADGKTGVRLSANVRATFSEEIEPSTLTQDSVVLINTKTGSAVAAEVSCDESCQTVTLNPLTKLAKKTKYKVVITTAVQDTEGDTLAKNETWSFTTGRS
jgi:hypothetical protein